jgi:hypothetical protein
LLIIYITNVFTGAGKVGAEVDIVTGPGVDLVIDHVTTDDIELGRGQGIEILGEGTGIGEVEIGTGEVEIEVETKIIEAGIEVGIKVGTKTGVEIGAKKEVDLTEVKIEIIIVETKIVEVEKEVKIKTRRAKKEVKKGMKSLVILVDKNIMVRVMVFYTTFSNILVILRRSVLLVEETEVSGEKH